MKLAKYINLERQDSLFYGSAKEPDIRYKRRQIKVVEDSFTFTASITDVSSITNWIKFWMRAGSKAKAVEYMQSTISNWTTHDEDEKDLFLDFVVYAGEPCVVSSLQKVDLQPLIGVPFVIFENGGVNAQKVWNGSTWG